MKISDEKIAKNVRKALKEAVKDYDEMNNLRDSYALPIEWHKEMLKVTGKRMLLEEILEIKS